MHTTKEKYLLVDSRISEKFPFFCTYFQKISEKLKTKDMTVNYEIGKPREDKRMRITLLLCVGKTKKRIKTDLFAYRTDLNRKGKLRNDTPLYGNLTKKIRAVESEYENLNTFLSGENISASEALNRMKHTDMPTFFKYAEEWLSKADMKGKKNYVTAIKNFRSYTQADIPFSMFSHILLKDYLYSLKDKPRAQSLYINAIKHIYNEAEKDYEIKSFTSFRLEIPRQQRAKNRALDKDTIKKVFAYQGTKKRALLARDCAILSFCLCGTNSADLFHAKTIKKNMLCYDRMKTKDRRTDNAHIEIEIPKQIKELVKKYRGVSHAFCFHTMYCNESTFNQNLNKGLKDIGDELGIKGLTFYAFRHSWATIARNDLGIEKHLVHEALNHNELDTAIDDIYIRKDFRLINKANKKVVDYVLPPNS